MLGPWAGCVLRGEEEGRLVTSSACLLHLLRQDGRPPGGEEDLLHQRGSGVPEALCGGGVHPQPVFLLPPSTAPPSSHQGQRVSISMMGCPACLPFGLRSCLSARSGGGGLSSPGSPWMGPILGHVTRGCYFHSFRRCLLNTYYVLSGVLGPGDAGMSGCLPTLHTSQSRWRVGQETHKKAKQRTERCSEPGGSKPRPVSPAGKEESLCGGMAAREMLW